MERLRQIKYTPEFKDIIAENPGALKIFLKLEEEIAAHTDLREEKVFEDGDVKITPLYDEVRASGYGDNKANSYLKVEIGDEAFFVKTIPGHNQYKDESGGVREFKNSKYVKEILRWVQGVEVVESQLGYEDKEKDVTYFVSKWMDLPRLNKVLNETRSLEMKDSLNNRVEIIQRRLNENNMMDVEPYNMFYDEKTDTIYVFDIFEKRDSSI
ncbi:MAG: hypothetical protein WC087_03685 [Candidatus Paceibacterota bacterium]